MKLDAMLSAHAFMHVERPPELWEIEAEDVTFIPMLGEMIVAGLVRGTDLPDLVLNVNNVTVEEPPPAAGDYVAITVGGGGVWSPELTWTPGDDVVLLTTDLDAAAVRAGAAYAYARATSGGGSLTVFMPRSGGTE